MYGTSEPHARTSESMDGHGRSLVRVERAVCTRAARQNVAEIWACAITPACLLWAIPYGKVYRKRPVPQNLHCYELCEDSVPELSV